MKITKYLVPVLTGLIVGGLVLAVNFPTSLNNFSTGDMIEANDWNALESTIGITNSADTTSHDYIIRHGSLTADYAYNSLTLTYGITAATGTFSGYITAAGFTGKASTTAAFASNPTNCSANQYPLGIDASGNVESCTADANTTYTAANPITLTGTIFGLNNDLSLTYGLTAATGSFSGYISAAGFTGNASTADALKANPTDCSANQFANAIAASGNLTCTQVTATDVPTALSRANWHSTTTAPGVMEKCFTMASSTWNNINTSTDLWYPYQPIIILSTICSNGGVNDDQGTTTAYFSDGTNNMDTMTCGYTTSEDTSLSNNTWTANETFRWTLNGITGTPNFTTACLRYYQSK